MSTSGLKTVALTLPASTEDLAKLEIGTVVEDGVPLPVPPAELGTANFHCSPAASIGDDGTLNVGAVTATASFRFAKWLDGWFKVSGCNVIIGKGGMSSETYKSAFLPNNAIYLTTVGYGTGALLGRGVKAVEAVHWLDELGLAQAMWMFRVENFGPFIVDSDLTGASLFARQGDIVNQKIASLYDGLKPPALHRFGETDDRKKEIM
jgi:L(+)-tartrate dehydratase beta subunit